MADKLPTSFTSLVAAQLSTDTQAYTQHPGGATAEGNYKYVLSDLVTFLKTQGFVKVISGVHIGDAEAIIAGGTIGDSYELAINNAYNIPVGNGGVLKIIK